MIGKKGWQAEITQEEKKEGDSIALGLHSPLTSLGYATQLPSLQN